LNACMDHFPFDGLAHLIAKQNFYTSYEALELAGQDGWSERVLGSRMLMRPAKIFWKIYVKKRGWADGWPGFVLAIVFTWVEFLRWAKCWEQVSGPSTRPPESVAMAESELSQAVRSSSDV